MLNKSNKIKSQTEALDKFSKNLGGLMHPNAEG